MSVERDIPRIVPKLQERRSADAADTAAARFPAPAALTIGNSSSFVRVNGSEREAGGGGLS